MARPYFTGNYGSALAKVDTRPIIEAGRAQGQMYANMGAQIGGMIKEYGLNKEKQKKADARVKSAINGMPEWVEAGVLKPEQKTMAEEFLNDPNKSSAEKVAFIEEQEKRMFQLPKLQLLKSQGKIAGLEAEVKDATKTNKIAMSALTNEAMELQNKRFEIQNAILTEQSENEKNRLRKEGELIDARIDNLKKTTKGIEGRNDIFDLTKDDIVTQNKLKTAEITTNLVLRAKQIEKLQREVELLGVNDTQERRKLEAQIGGLEAAADRDLAEAELLKKQADQLNNLTGGEPTPTKPFELPEGIEEGAQGDLPGIVKGAINSISDFMALGTPFEKSRDAKAKVEVLRSQLMPAFLNSISDKGAQWAKDEVLRILPAPGDSDGVFRAKMKELPNILNAQLRQDIQLLKLPDIGTQTQRGQAARNIQKFPLLIESLEKILEQDDPGASSRGTTSTNIEFQILGD